MDKENSSYRQSFKGITVFGGLQVFVMLTGVIRSKFVALLLGPTGMGIISLFSSTIELLGAFTDFNLKTTAVQRIGKHSDDLEKVSKIKATLQKLVWITGLLGALACFFFAEVLSIFTFESEDYTLAFRWLSVVLLINQLCDSQNAMLQGLRKIRWVVKSNMLGGITGLAIAIPLYHYFGVDGIVPAIISTSLLMFVFSALYVRKIELPKVNLTIRETSNETKEMLHMGLMLSIAGVFPLIASYLIRIYIGKSGGLEDVGFYTAGFTLISTCVGLFFKAMSYDFFPKLSSIASNSVASLKAINQQAEITTLILAPVLCFFMIFVNWMVALIYTSEFTVVTRMLQWASLGMVFKAGIWAASLQFLAKGHSKLFLWNELAFNFYVLILNVLCYQYFGLDGLGISFLISYLLYFLQVWLVTQKKYNFHFSSDYSKLLTFHLSLTGCCFLLVITPFEWSILASLVIAIFSMFISFKQLEKRGVSSIR